MATKPTPGGSDGTYGTEMNAFLDVSLASDGKVKDGSVFSTSAAPSVDAGVANKKYVDDQISANIGGDTPTTDDSESNSMLKAHAYLTQTSGFVNAFATLQAGENLIGFVGSTNDPAGAGATMANTQTDTNGRFSAISFFVGNGKYFEITVSSGTPTILWTPLVTGGAAPIDQD